MGERGDRSLILDAERGADVFGRILGLYEVQMLQ